MRDFAFFLKIIALILTVIAMIYGWIAKRNLQKLKEQGPQVETGLEGDEVVETTTSECLQVTATSQHDGVTDVTVKDGTKSVTVRTPLRDCTKVTFQKEGGVWQISMPNTFYLVEKADNNALREQMTRLFGDPDKAFLSAISTWKNKPYEPPIRFLDIPPEEATRLFSEGILAWPDPNAEPGDMASAVKIPWGMPLPEVEKLGLFKREVGGEEPPLQTIKLPLACPIQIGHILVTRYMTSSILLSIVEPPEPFMGLFLTVFCTENAAHEERAITKAPHHLGDGWAEGTAFTDERHSNGVRLLAKNAPELYFGASSICFSDESGLLIMEATATVKQPPVASVPLYREGPLVEDDATVLGAPCAWALASYAGRYVEEIGDKPRTFPAPLEGDTSACIWLNPQAKELGFAAVAPQGGYIASLLPLRPVEALRIHVTENGIGNLYAQMRYQENFIVLSSEDGESLRKAAPLLAKLSGKPVYMVHGGTMLPAHP